MNNQGGGYRPGGDYSKERQGQGGYQNRDRQSGGYQSGGKRPGGQGSRDDEGPRPEQLIPLPASIRHFASQLTHPGLALDKYAATVDLRGEEIIVNNKQERQFDVLRRMIEISRHPEPKAAWQQFFKRQEAVWQGLNCHTFSMETISGLSMHLARASALENAGICLHNLYGFPIIPGSGLKGLTRAWATNEGHDADLIRQIFGASAEDVRQKHGEQAGSIIFYDAIPRIWPELSVDIVNNHHSKYYAGKDAAGDWESPIPVYFLTVEAGAKFAFALGKTHTQVSDDLLTQAAQWLQSALTWSGAGAKTNAGYGLFKAEQGISASAPESRACFSANLQLVTPAFLAGALQDGRDCDLRPATLRGMLRWWWRTMHSGFLSTKDMLRLENLIFGSASEGGALQIRVEAKVKKEVFAYNKKQLVTGYPDPPDQKTTQGLWYHSFGMNDGGKQRYLMPEEASWEVTLSARKQNQLSAQDILNQAVCALQLLCHYGAVGAKQRKGWGCFSDLPGFDLAQCKQIARAMRVKWGVTAGFSKALAESPSLEEILPPLEITTPWTNTFWVLHQLGNAGQDFAKKYKHQAEKKALGLPRRIGQPIRGSFRSPLDRHSSPTQFHIARDSTGKLVIRAMFFIAPKLPDRETSRAFLHEYREALEQSIKGRLKETQREATVSQRRPGSSPGSGYVPRSGTQGSGYTPRSTPQQVAPSGLKSGAEVKAVLLEEKTKKGGWKAKHLESGKTGPIVNSERVQGHPGDTVTLIVHSDQPSFRWP